MFVLYIYPTCETLGWEDLVKSMFSFTVGNGNGNGNVRSVQTGCFLSGEPLDSQSLRKSMQVIQKGALPLLAPFMSMVKVIR